MNVLSIGNSFSMDAHRWLHDIACAGGVELQAVNLYIGGCSLATHLENWAADQTAYEYFRNGQYVKRSSIKAALTEGNWDVVTLQQASHFSGEYATYQPYLSELAAVIREYCPDATLYIHQTWAYEIDAAHEGFARYGRSQERMYEALTDAYRQAAEAVGAATLPVGEVIQTLRRRVAAFDYANGGLSLCKDGFHLTETYGRYAAALTWYGVLTEKDVRENTFAPLAEGMPVEAAVLDSIRKTVYDVINGEA